jgi:hypothetical protein
MCEIHSTSNSSNTPCYVHIVRVTHICIRAFFTHQLLNSNMCWAPQVHDRPAIVISGNMVPTKSRWVHILRSRHSIVLDVFIKSNP